MPRQPSKHLLRIGSYICLLGFNFYLLDESLPLLNSYYRMFVGNLVCLLKLIIKSYVEDRFRQYEPGYAIDLLGQSTNDWPLV